MNQTKNSKKPKTDIYCRSDEVPDLSIEQKKNTKKKQIGREDNSINIAAIYMKYSS